MATQFTATVTSFVERGIDHFLMKPPTSYGVIVVRPPVEPGELFKRAVLGKEWCLVDIQLLFKTGRATVFLAESSIEEQAARHQDIEDIARRLGELANRPESALRLMEEKPFAEPDKPEPVLQIGSDGSVAVHEAGDGVGIVQEPAAVAEPPLKIPKVVEGSTVSLRHVAPSEFGMGTPIPFNPSPDGQESVN